MAKKPTIASKQCPNCKVSRPPQDYKSGKSCSKCMGKTITFDIYGPKGVGSEDSSPKPTPNRKGIPYDMSTYRF